MQTTISNKSNADQSMLNKFFLEELQDIYGAEKQLTKAIPEMGKAATSEDLIMAFADHLKVTENQIVRLERVFEAMGEMPQAKKCEGMEGLVKEAQKVISDTEAGTATRDVGLVVSAQKVEHYEIAAYGSLRQLARLTGNAEITQLLEETLAEEKETDMVL
jgi:ferritin-like metal-binding protein YciE